MMATDGPQDASQTPEMASQTRVHTWANGYGMPSDPIGALYLVVSDHDLETLDSLMIAAALMWRCECGDMNRSDQSTCHRASNHETEK